MIPQGWPWGVGAALFTLACTELWPSPPAHLGTQSPEIVAPLGPTRPEPSWVKVVEIGPTHGPPDLPCSTQSTNESPGAPPPPPAKGGAARSPGFDPETFPRIDFKPNVLNSDLSPELKARALNPLDLASLPQEPLRGNPEDIFRLQRVLNRTGQPTRIAFWGASHVAGEYFTGQIRRVLQTDYGDAGHGFVMPAPPWQGYRASDVNLCAGGTWVSDFDSRVGGRNDGMLGPGGMSVEAIDAASFAWVQTTTQNPQGRSIDRFEVLFIKQATGGVLKAQVDDAPPVEISTQGTPGPGALILKLQPGPHRLTLSPAGNGPVRLVGVNMEQSGTGIVVDAMGVNGRTASSWLRWDMKQMQTWLTRRPYDMIVLAYGTNEGNDNSLSPESYRQSLTAVLKQVRSLLPETPCLLIGPGDRGKKVKDQIYSTWPPHSTIAHIQAEVAPQFGCASWDLQAAMGGEGSVFSWWKADPALMSNDLIHFSAAGYKELANRLLGQLRP